MSAYLGGQSDVHKLLLVGTCVLRISARLPASVGFLQEENDDKEGSNFQKRS
jgi:hypothetical protein